MYLFLQEIIEPGDHDYTTNENNVPNIITNTPKQFSITEETTNNTKNKRLPKSTRLFQSIKNNEKFLKINEEKAMTDKTYKEQKLEIMRQNMENKMTYYKQKNSLLRQILTELSFIRESLSSK